VSQPQCSKGWGKSVELYSGLNRRFRKGRLRQFNQVGVEALGPDTNSPYAPYLDAELIALSVNLIKEFGLNDFELKINTLGTSSCKDNLYKLIIKKLKGELSELCEDCQKRFKGNAFRVLDCKNKKCRSIVKRLNLGSDWLTQENKDYFEKVKEALKILNIDFSVDSTLVRGLDYYTNTVFEVSSPELGSQNALGAGGRYNDLVGQLGGSSVGAIGFALGIERVLLAMPKTLEGWGKRLQAYVVAFDENCLEKAFEILNTLRSQGISSDINYGAGLIKKQMKAADRSKARYVLILGEDEIKNNSVTLKDMDSSKQDNQESVPVDKITEVIKSKL